ncbi:hypothetical protein K458DRAFT_94752 [Lentithecium fluviatile CBS 122367]|uniref:Uncharacterized protein n=1 Tax=Lentithecium fluviatile CBS 122367 TaxID=1168545 RepID=A0A6G1IR09_9PLEO|nr:hypothetical protein K458DRAFT_94752 [Lentithecium fluviatile CBS 122367]
MAASSTSTLKTLRFLLSSLRTQLDVLESMKVFWRVLSQWQVLVYLLLGAARQEVFKPALYYVLNCSLNCEAPEKDITHLQLFRLQTYPGRYDDRVFTHADKMARLELTHREDIASRISGLKRTRGHLKAKVGLMPRPLVPSFSMDEEYLAKLLRKHEYGMQNSLDHQAIRLLDDKPQFWLAWSIYNAAANQQRILVSAMLRLKSHIRRRNDSLAWDKRTPLWQSLRLLQAKINISILELQDHN